MTTIDWFASARVSSAHGSDEFVVRELYAEEAPRVLIVTDRCPSMALYEPDLPWLDKPRAVVAAAEAIARSAAAARAELGHADSEGGHPRLLSPGAVAPRRVLERVRRAAYDAAPESLTHTLAQLVNRRAELPQGSFIFILSDFLAAMPAATLARLQASRWDVVPVIVQDPTWEQSFPAIPGIVLPVSAPGGDRALVRLTATDVATLRRENEARLAALLRRFRGLGFDPVELGTAEPSAVDATFLRWAERRRRRRRRR